MKRFARTILTLFFAFAALAPDLAPASTTYPAGTSIEDAWLSPPRIPPDEAASLLADRFLTPHAPGTEPVLGSEEIEAFKYLVGDHVHSTEEPAPEPGRRRFTGEIDPENMTPEQRQFFGALSFALANRLGLTALDPQGACVAQRRLWEVTKYDYDLGWNEVEVWGVTAFGHNVQYGMNHSDLVYGVFPFGIRMSWWQAAKCSFDKPNDEEELRACGRAKEWKIHGDAWIILTSPYDAAVPGVAQASLTYAGALVSGEADQFRTNEQTRSPANQTWLLGPSNTPLPSAVHTTLGECIGCDGRIPMDTDYRFSRVLAWFPNIILNASYNNLVPRSAEVFRYTGKGDGNPHGLKTWSVQRSFSRHHEPLPGCT